ncbi:hypothetical protein ZWY2020_054755 [Hordeum vulgare]|nr:hypothetical protein ZWY2020_054755 [Hordeum vulgare]
MRRCRCWDTGAATRAHGPVVGPRLQERSSARPGNSQRRRRSSITRKGGAAALAGRGEPPEARDEGARHRASGSCVGKADRGVGVALEELRQWATSGPAAEPGRNGAVAADARRDKGGVAIERQQRARAGGRRDMGSQGERGDRRKRLRRAG